MSEETSPSAHPQQSPGQLMVDLGPVVLFVAAYNIFLRIAGLKDNAIYLATGIFIVATLAAIAWCLFKRGKVAPVLIVTGVIVTLFGGMTILFHDENFVKLRPTFANFFYAAAIAGALLFRQNIWKLLFGHVFTLPDRIWNILAWRWAAFFFAMGFLAEFIRRTMTTSDWMSWHFPILYVPTVLFAIANTPLVLKHQPPEQSTESAQPGA